MVTPSKKIPTRCVGPSAILNLVPAACEISYIPANKTRVYKCQAARLVLVKNPAFCNKAYRSAATLRSPFCILRKTFGNTTSLTFNGGTVRVDLAAAEDSLTRGALERLAEPVAIDEPANAPGNAQSQPNALTSVLDSLSERAVRAAIQRGLESGVSLATSLLGK